MLKNKNKIKKQKKKENTKKTQLIHCSYKIVKG